MKTAEESRILKEYFLNASLLAIALELAKEFDSLERAKAEDAASDFAEFDDDTAIAA